MNQPEETKSQPENEWQILKDVYTMLLDGKVLNTPIDEPIVRFKHPEELWVSQANNVVDYNEIFRNFYKYLILMEKQ